MQIYSPIQTHNFGGACNIYAPLQSTFCTCLMEASKPAGTTNSFFEPLCFLSRYSIRRTTNRRAEPTETRRSLFLAAAVRF